MDSKDTLQQVNRGRWSKQEHLLFLTALSEYGKDWKSIQVRLPSRTPVQIRSHAQKYFAQTCKHMTKLYTVLPQTLVFKDYFSFLQAVRSSPNPLVFVAMQQQYITIDPFHLDMSITYIAMIVLGGIGTIFGAVAGAIAFSFLKPLAEYLGPMLPFISELSTAQQSSVLFSIVVCAFLVFEPLGIFGLWLRIKRFFMAWPFRY